MKRMWGWIFLLTIGIGTIFFVENQRVRARKLYLKEETMLRHLKKEPFLAKNPTPWMLEQIEEDFQGIASIPRGAVDEVFDTAKNFSPMVARYRIIDGELYRYFVEDEPVSLSDNGTEKAIKTILQRIELPNMDFMVSYFDGFPFGISPHDLKIPIFVSAKLKNTPNGILIPDWRSIGHWWMSEIKEVKRAFIPWEKKRSFALWRGGLTKPLRYELCKLSLQYPDLLDARLNHRLADFEERQDLKDVLGERCSWREFTSCKYLPYIDGVMCASPALQSRLLSGSLTLKPDSDEIQWFYGALKPYDHYVPVKSDLSDLIEKIEWAKAHDDESRAIAERARHFALENLMYSDVLNYFSFVLKRYGTCQKLDSREIKEEMQQDVHWVKIQYREQLRELAQENNMSGYCLESTPPAL